MSRFVFLGSAVFVGIMAVGVLSPHIHRAQETPAAAVTSPARVADSPSPTHAPIVAAAAPVQPRDGGTPTGLLVAAGLILGAAGVSVGLTRLRTRTEAPEVALRHRWYAVLTAHTADGVTEVHRGLLEFPASSASAVEREVVARYEARYGRPGGTVHACQAEPAWPWVILAGRRVLEEGAVPLLELSAAEAAVEVLGEYATARGLAYAEVLGLHCVVHGPDEVGEADGRDW